MGTRREFLKQGSLLGVAGILQSQKYLFALSEKNEKTMDRKIRK